MPLRAFLSPVGCSSKMASRGRRLHRWGRDSCRPSSVWGADSSARPRRGLPSSLSDLSGLPLAAKAPPASSPPSGAERPLPPTPHLRAGEGDPLLGGQEARGLRLPAQPGPSARPRGRGWELLGRQGGRATRPPGIPGAGTRLREPRGGRRGRGRRAAARGRHLRGGVRAATVPGPAARPSGIGLGDPHGAGRDGVGAVLVGTTAGDAFRILVCAQGERASLDFWK